MTKFQFLKHDVCSYFSWILLFFVPCTIFSTSTPLPQIIDFNTVHLTEIAKFPLGSLEEKTTNSLQPFNSAPELALFFSYLKQVYPIDTVIETGTWRGRTTAFFSLLFAHIHTIDVSPDIYQKAKASLKPYSNITCHLGSSEKILSELLPSLKEKPILFYLDAHWRQFWPLLQELKEISKTHKDHCIIVIDDFKVPGRADIPYDAYGDHACSYEYIKNGLSEIFSDYTVHYLIPKSTYCRAKFVAIPKQWRQKT